MRSWTKELDEATVLVTSKGCWHTVLTYLLCALAAIPVSVTVFVQIFTNATPEHWCAPPPELEALPLPEAVLRNLTVPHRGGLYEKCSSYVLDTNALFKELHDLFDERTTLPHDGGELGEKKTYQLKPVREDQRDEQITRIVEKVMSMRKKSDNCTNGWRYSTEQYANTLVTEFSLVCGRDWLTPLSSSFFWFGSLVGNVLFGWMSDRYGRKFTILFMVYLVVPLTIFSAFPNSYIMYIILKFIGGLFYPSLYQQPLILATELMPPAKRTKAGIVTGLIFSVGMCLLALTAYAIRDWYQLTLATSVPFILLFGYYWLIPESPRWLAGKGRPGDAEKVLRALAKKNGINLPPGFLLDIHIKVSREEDVIFTAVDQNVKLTDAFEKANVKDKMNTQLQFELNHKMLPKKKNENEIVPNFLIVDEKTICNTKQIPFLSDSNADVDEEISKEFAVNSQMRNSKSESSQTVTEVFLKSDADVTEDSAADNYTEVHTSMLDLFRYPNIRKKFLISTCDCLIITVIYNGLSYNTSNLGVNDYVAFFIGGAVEFPAYILIWRCMERFGRRWVLCLFMIVCGLSCLICGLIPEDLPWVTLALAMIGKLCSAACFAVCYLLIGELLPTVVRAQGIGLSSFITGVGILACPYIVYSAIYMQTLPLIIMGVLGIIAGMFPLFLPETLNQPLPETITDAEMFGTTIKIFSCIR